MSDKRYVVGLGEALWDVLPEGKKLGGAPANFAYHAGQFVGSDNSIAISALGEDKLAEETIEALEEHGLKYLMPHVPYPTGTVQVTSRPRLRKLLPTAAPFATARWLSAMSFRARTSTASSTPPLATA